MNNLTTSAIAVIALSGMAHAGGFERSDQSVAILFKEGRQLEFGFRAGFPEVDGVGTSNSTPGVESGNIAENFVDFYAAFKFDLNESFSAAIVYDEPFATKINYPTSNYFLSEAMADLKVRELVGVVQYNLPPSMAVLGGGFSVYGGPRVSYLTASADVPAVGNYSIDVDSQFGFGYLAGFAWERPELGMRVSLTYNSEIRNDLDTQETLGGQVTNTTTALDPPESLTLEFQTGLNPKTLLFGSVRWVPWGDFTIEPPTFTGRTGNPLAFFPDDTITYRLGLGRRLTQDFSIFGDVSYEPGVGGDFGNLTPRDGFLSFGVGGTYQFDKMSLTLGARYALLGDADTAAGPGRPNVGQFRDNDAFFVGARLGFDLN